MENVNLKSGEFLVKEVDANSVFIPEEFNEEQRMIAQTCRDFLEAEVYPNLEKRASMRKLACVLGVLLIITILMTGCTTPLKTTNYSQDQILGTWRYQEKLLEARISFEADGNFHMNVQNAGQDLRVLSGTWNPVDTNNYKLTYTTNAQETWLYDPSSDTIHESRYTSVIYSRYNGSYEIKYP